MTDELMLDEGFHVQSAFRPFVMIYHDVLQALDIYQLAVYAHLVKYANAGRGAFPSTKTLADDAKISRRKVFDSLKELEGMGLIHRQARFLGDDGKSYPNYRPGSKQVSSLITVFDRVSSMPEEGTPYASGAYPPMHEVHTPYASGAYPPMHEVHTRTRLNINYNQINYKSLGEIEDSAIGEKAEPAKKRESYKPEFEEFWKRYPRKVGDKRKAQSKFFEAVEEVGLDVLMGAVDRFKAEVEQRGTATTYVKHPLTWLNQKVYLDYVRASSVSDSASREQRGLDFSQMMRTIAAEHSASSTQGGLGFG